MARVVALNVAVTLENGLSYPQCVQTQEWTPLEPGGDEYKFYALGIGLVREQPLDGGPGLELVGIRSD